VTTLRRVARDRVIALLALPLLAMLMLASVAGPAAAAQATSPETASFVATLQPEAQPRPSLGGAELEAQTRAVSALLRCPVCQGESIQDSPADLAVEMRAVVRDQLAAGRTPDEVKAYFVARYGEWILLAPPARGFNLLLYLLPFALLIFGGGVLFASARRWQRRSTVTSDGERDALAYSAAEADEPEY
jgi:cytochrome c-type biogenesis protein CcmH